MGVRFSYAASDGEVSERFKEPVLKTGDTLIRTVGSNPTLSVQKGSDIMSETTICPNCGKIVSKKELGTHIWRVHGDGVNFDPNRGYKDGTRTPWNKGLTRETDDRVDRISKKLERKQSDLELLINDDGKLKQRWKNKRVNAKAEELECNLTYDEFCQLVYDAGLVSSQLGFTGDCYVLARYNDSGNYDFGNCRFITQKENVAEKNERIFHKEK